MDRKLYYKCLANQDITKFGEWQGRHFLNKENNIEILFIFLHRGFPQSWHMENTRIILEVYKTKTLIPEVPKKAIENETLILVNADTMDFSSLFKLTIDSKNKEVKVIMVEEPIQGKSIISEEEKKGLIVPFPT